MGGTWERLEMAQVMLMRGDGDGLNRKLWDTYAASTLLGKDSSNFHGMEKKAAIAHTKFEGTKGDYLLRFACA